MTIPSRAAALGDLDGPKIPAWMATQIRADAAASRFARWGRSTVVDENTGEPVLSRELFDELHELAGLTGIGASGADGAAGVDGAAGADGAAGVDSVSGANGTDGAVGADSAVGEGVAWPIGNAGLLHVYGYLLSTADTLYGRKRDRWIDGGVARAFGLPADAFAPWFVTPSANDSTPLERITAVAEPFAADPADGDFTVLWIDETGKSGEIARTVVVRDEDSGAAALLYAVGTTDQPLLVTLFPLEGFDPKWLEGATAGSPRLRYNAVDGRNVSSAPLADREVTLRNF